MSWELQPAEMAALSGLLRDWGHAYSITRFPRRWEAVFADAADPPLTAATADGLRILISADYDHRTEASDTRSRPPQDS